MSIINKLATSLNRRDEVPNQELAKIIVDKKDTTAVKELVDNLTNKNKNIQNDCIKVLYEVGELQPLLISDYVKEFTSLLENKNNRLQWGGMLALSKIVTQNPKAIYSVLAKIILAANKGSVITKDGAVAILIKLYTLKRYSDEAFALLNEQILNSATNQLPMYAENALPVIDDKHKTIFIKTLSSRLEEIEKDTKRKRVEKVIRKLAAKIKLPCLLLL